MNEEIGGYFELESNKGDLYHNNAIKLNLARNSLVYVIKSRKIKKLHIPYYLCDSVNIATKYCTIEYYKVNKQFLPEIEENLDENEYIYIVNYFGLISNDKITKLKKIYKNIIVDNVQAFFQKPINGVDTIYSCRKFFGVPDGSYLYTNKRLDEKLEEDSSIDRFKHILGRTEKNASEYYEEYKKNEELLGRILLKEMSKSTEAILSGIDYKKDMNIRTKNFKYLNNKLKNINMLKLTNIKGAFAYPLYINDAPKVRDVLIKNKIYVPILWPNVIRENKDNLAYDYANNILPIPCDQRYDIKDMNKIIKLVKGID